MMECEICGRKAEREFCQLHEAARRNLLENFEAWKKAMNISWNGYLEEVQKNPYAGVWVKEVAQHLQATVSSREAGDSASI
ncbi:MAG: hypothetical protein NWF14_09250 [Candidatus Bathyarchaeota archaeon]|nr:hypothetical protein [Candidatus Bathyarchaeota archaeon]